MIIRSLLLTASAAAFCLVGASPGFGDDGKTKDATVVPPGVIFSSLLPDIPGKRLVAVALEFDPKSERHSMPHRHPGSVYVYVTKGAMKLGIDGQPVQLVHAGESFFEPPGALHTVAESASPTEPASAIAVLIVPDGAPLLTVDGQKK
jgi:quercetin dioxygenase-like cupin family protein